MTRRSSSEWKEIPANRPPSRSRSQASGSAASSCVELVVDGDADRLEDALGRVAAGEARRRRDRADDRRRRARWSSRSAARRARRTIARAIAAGVALLAVVAEQRAPAGARPSSLTIVGARVELLVGVHAHVQRRVVGVGEAALARVDLHRGHAEVEVDEVGARRPRRASSASAVGEARADEARRARRPRRRAPSKRSSARRVAVDRDRACPSARGGRRPGARGRRRRTCSRRRSRPGCGSSSSISSPASTGTWVVVMSSRMAKARGDLGDLPSSARSVVRPARRGPRPRGGRRRRRPRPPSRARRARCRKPRDHHAAGRVELGRRASCRRRSA